MAMPNGNGYRKNTQGPKKCVTFTLFYITDRQIDYVKLSEFFDNKCMQKQEIIPDAKKLQICKYATKIHVECASA